MRQVGERSIEPGRRDERDQQDAPEVVVQVDAAGLHVAEARDVLVDGQRQRAQERERDRERPPAEDEAAPGGVDVAELPRGRSRGSATAAIKASASPAGAARRIAAAARTGPDGLQIASRLQRAVPAAARHVSAARRPRRGSTRRLPAAIACEPGVAARDVDRLWDDIEAQRRRLGQPAWRLTDLAPPADRARAAGAAALAPAGLPPGRAPCRAVRPPSAVRRPPSRSSSARHLQECVAAACLLSIAVTVGEIAALGIGQRPSLIVAELCALVLAPFAILLGSVR